MLAGFFVVIFLLPGYYLDFQGVYEYMAGQILVPSFFIGYVLYGPLDEYYKIFNILGTPVKPVLGYNYQQVDQNS